MITVNFFCVTIQAYDATLHELSKCKSAATAVEHHSSGVGALLRYISLMIL